jgi:hypothetical protein
MTWGMAMLEQLPGNPEIPTPQIDSSAHGGIGSPAALADRTCSPTGLG